LLAVCPDQGRAALQKPLKLQLLDGTSITVVPDANAKCVEDILQHVGQRLGIQNVEEYGLVG
jgi:hypothetical protein